MDKQVRKRNGKTALRARNKTSESLEHLLTLSGKSSKYMKDLLRRVQIKTNFSNTAFGNFKELDSLLSGVFIQGMQVGSLGGGTDSIYIGDLTIDYETNFSETELFKEQENLLKQLKKELKPNNSPENAERFKELIIKLNELYKNIDSI